MRKSSSGLPGDAPPRKFGNLRLLRLHMTPRAEELEIFGRGVRRLLN